MPVFPKTQYDQKTCLEKIIDIPLKMSICNDLHVATTAVESVKILPQDLQQKTVGSSARFRSMSGPLSASISATCVFAFAFSKGTPESVGWLRSRPPTRMVTLFYAKTRARVEVRSFGKCRLLDTNWVIDMGIRPEFWLVIAIYSCMFHLQSRCKLWHLQITGIDKQCNAVWYVQGPKKP